VPLYLNGVNLSFCLCSCYHFLHGLTEKLEETA
jgi:hypothetical protein